MVFNCCQSAEVTENVPPSTTGYTPKKLNIESTPIKKVNIETDDATVDSIVEEEEHVKVAGNNSPASTGHSPVAESTPDEKLNVESTPDSKLDVESTTDKKLNVETVTEATKPTKVAEPTEATDPTRATDPVEEEEGSLLNTCCPMQTKEDDTAQSQAYKCWLMSNNDPSTKSPQTGSYNCWGII